MVNFVEASLSLALLPSLTLEPRGGRNHPIKCVTLSSVCFPPWSGCLAPVRFSYYGGYLNPQKPNVSVCRCLWLIVLINI